MESVLSAFLFTPRLSVTLSSGIIFAGFWPGDFEPSDSEDESTSTAGLDNFWGLLLLSQSELDSSSDSGSNSGTFEVEAVLKRTIEPGFDMSLRGGLSI